LDEMRSSFPEKLKSALHVSLSAAFERLSGLTNSRLESVGLIYRHYLILCVLNQGDGNYYQQELGEMVGANRSTMVQLTDQLEKLNLVRRQQNPENRRQLIINITDKGIKAVNQADKLVDIALEEFSAPLTKPERAQLSSLLSKLAT